MFHSNKTDKYRLTWLGNILQQSFALINRSRVVPSTLPYNLTISERKKFVWFRVAKVATRTIINHLHQHDVPLSTVEAMNIYYLPGRFKDYFKFGFVRNPWDRLVSGWQQMIVLNNHFPMTESHRKALMNFSTFIGQMETNPTLMNNHHFKPQHKLIDLNNLDFLGRLENFHSDFTKVLNSLGIPSHDIPHYNRTTIQDYSSYYNPALRERVYQLYEKDFRLFYPDA